MDLHIDFSAFDALRKEMGIEEVKNIYEGVFVKPKDIKTEGNVLIYKGKPVLLYIREAQYTPKYHISKCNTIQSFIEAGREQRYVAVRRDKNNPSTSFKVYWQETGVEETLELTVCKNCLNEIEYKGFSYSGSSWSRNNDIFENFDLIDFFENYLPKMLGKLEGLTSRREGDGNIDKGYTDDWETISTNYRASKNWTCEECGVDLKNDTKYLDTHHINGVKNDNRKSNLKALCIKCHAKQPRHEHLKTSSRYIDFENPFL